MSQHLITINSHTNYLSLAKQLSELDVVLGVDLEIKLECGNFINSEVYMMLVSFVNETRACGHGINVAIDTTHKCDTLNYASRINFFKLLDIDFKENFRRGKTNGNMIAITKIEPGVMDLSDEILNVFENDFKMSNNDIDQLSLIISEMLCNSSIHSKCKSGAYLYCQKYRGNENCLEFILVDSGIGIKKSLSKKEEFANLTNGEAVAKALEYEVTCGEGRGHGLYFASEFVKRNNGEMVLMSGKDHVEIKGGTVKVGTNNHWDGVLLKIKFKFDADISLNKLMSEKNYSNINN